MYISELQISGYRGFSKDINISFQEGMNVLIGPNNAGKSTVISAMNILFGTHARVMNINDFNKSESIDQLKIAPPNIMIKATMRESEKEEKYSKDLLVVSTWLTKIDRPYEATITYVCQLPEKELDDYKRAMNRVNSDNIDDYWYAIEYKFLRKYVCKIYAGPIENKTVVDPETLDKFDFQFLDAIRDVGRDMFSGKKALLKEVIDFFMDYDIKISSISEEEKNVAIEKNKRDFSVEAQKLLENLQNRMSCGKTKMMRYVSDTGAGFNGGIPDFDGRILDTELYSALQLIVKEKTGINLPISHNGLGYNNLIYISLLLAKMQKNSSEEYMGSNAKVFPILAIEEPEAHLHPNMQYKFLKFLGNNLDNDVRQMFITTHSPNVTAATSLDNLIILGKDNKLQTLISYPGKSLADDVVSKKYVQRFLDVTKADMFFANRLIFVEGLAEQLLLPVFARKLGYDLSDNHISIININGRYAQHFLKMFDTEKLFSINKKIVYITDKDPVRKTTEKGAHDKACCPILLYADKDNYDYQETSNPSINEPYSSNIKVFSQKEGSTFEYQLAFENPTCEALITSSVSNKKELKGLMKSMGEDNSKFLSILKDTDFKEEVEALLKKSSLIAKFKEHILAQRYLKSISKGVVAQELVEALDEEHHTEYAVPKYIEEAIKWICQ